jgi:late competence protein required for DNA uptake (superfamily II DNA/RNA helicase)
MGRPRRQITSEGHLYCPQCATWKHISLFGRTSNKVFWTETVDGVAIEYGWPRSYCKECDNIRRKERDRILAAEKRSAEKLVWDGFSVPTEAQVAEMLRRKREDEEVSND